MANTFIDECKRSLVPDLLPMPNENYSRGWNACRAEVQKRIDEIAKKKGREVFFLTGFQVKTLLDLLGGYDEDSAETELAIGPLPEHKDAESGELRSAGLYAWFHEYPDEGSIPLPEAPDHGVPDYGSSDGQGPYYRR